MKKEVTSKVKDFYLSILDKNDCLESIEFKVTGENLYQALSNQFDQKYFNIIELGKETLVILKYEITYLGLLNISAIYKLIKDEKEDNT